MVTDAVCWFIFGSGIALLWCGCRFTRPMRRPIEESFEIRYDQAA